MQVDFQNSHHQCFERQLIKKATDGLISEHWQILVCVFVEPYPPLL